MIGLSGAHRTGKTTLAKAWAEQQGVDYLTISTAEVVRGVMGGDCSEIVDLETRLRVQAALVERCDAVFRGRRTPFVSDRTPIDVAAYLLADISQSPLPDHQERRVLELIENCMDITNAYFGGVMIIPPALPYVIEPGKPLPNRAYQFHHHALVGGLLHDSRVNVPFWTLNMEVVSLEARVQVLTEIYEHLLSNHSLQSEVVSHH